MKRNIQILKPWHTLPGIILMPLLAIIVSILFPIISYAQPFSITGVVSTATEPVQNATVTFALASDTTVKYITQTDALGQYQIDILTSVKPGVNLPAGFELEQNYPNPFLSSTSIPYKLNSQANVKLTIYDILGREIKKITSGLQSAGVHGIIWDGKNNAGEKIATGIYFYRLQVGGEAQVKKMIYGMGQKNVFISLPNMAAPQTTAMNKRANMLAQQEIFNVYVENTGTANPIIISQQFNNIAVQNDTTLNFTVIENVLNSAIVYTDSTRQIIRGFGAAYIRGWRPAITTDQINRAFGTGAGQVGLSIMRIRVPNDSSQFALEVSAAKTAYDLGATIIASPWSPPAWMKTINNTTGGELKTSAYAAYAAHLKAFADTMENNGVPLYGISIQNEPDVTVTYESCDWDATQLLNFTKNNAESIGHNVFMPESYHYDKSMSDATLNDPDAAEHVTFVGEHIYGGTLNSYSLALSKGKEVWMTEHYTNSSAGSINWANAMIVGKEMHDCMSANMSAYVWWYVVRYYGPINDTNYVVTQRGYAMSQYSKFVRPGFYRIKSTENPRTDLYVTAYKNGSDVVIVAVNNGSSVSQTFICPWGGMTAFTPYVSSSNKNCAQESDISFANHRFTVTLDASSITTFVSK